MSTCLATQPPYSGYASAATLVHRAHQVGVLREPADLDSRRRRVLGQVVCEVEGPLVDRSDRAVAAPLDVTERVGVGGENRTFEAHLSLLARALRQLPDQRRADSASS